MVSMLVSAYFWAEDLGRERIYYAQKRFFRNNSP